MPGNETSLESRLESRFGMDFRMNLDWFALGSLLVGLAILLLLWRRGQGGELAGLRLLLEQNLAAQRGEAETTRHALAASERALIEKLVELRLEHKDTLHDLAHRLGESQSEARSALEGRLREMNGGQIDKLAAIERQINEQLHQSRDAIYDLTRRLAETQAEAREAVETRLREIGGGHLEKLTAIERHITEQLTQARDAIHEQTRRLGDGQTEARVLMETKLRELAEFNLEKLAAIERQVNEQLHAAVEKQMESSFQRVIEQFAAVQKAMGDVQAVTAQIGDLRRVFSNVKTRGGWGETQLKSLLDDMLPPGGYEMNRKLSEGSDEIVEFVVYMPSKGDPRPLMAIDAKFPMEDYERLLDAAATGDAESEKAARRSLENRVKLEARKIADKYIVPPVTVEFAVLYLPTDGLFAELARAPGLFDEISRTHRVMILGPSLLPAMLRTIHLGFMTMALEQKAGEIRHLLGATHTEMIKMDDVLSKLAKNASQMGTTIEAARTRTRVMRRKLKNVEIVDVAESEALFASPETVLIGAAEDDE